MNEIQKYRRASVKTLGWFIETVANREYYTTGRDEKGIRRVWLRVEKWLPDEICDQREMIEDRLIEQGCSIYLEYDSGEGYNHWTVTIYVLPPQSDLFREFEATNKSKSIAFMKAFMKYINK